VHGQGTVHLQTSNQSPFSLHSGMPFTGAPSLSL
jgi:hypothetical protein